MPIVRYVYFDKETNVTSLGFPTLGGEISYIHLPDKGLFVFPLIIIFENSEFFRFRTYFLYDVDYQGSVFKNTIVPANFFQSQSFIQKNQNV